MHPVPLTCEYTCLHAKGPADLRKDVDMRKSLNCPEVGRGQVEVYVDFNREGNISTGAGSSALGPDDRGKGPSGMGHRYTAMQLRKASR